MEPVSALEALLSEELGSAALAQKLGRIPSLAVAPAPPDDAMDLEEAPSISPPAPSVAPSIKLPMSEAQVDAFMELSVTESEAVTAARNASSDPQNNIPSIATVISNAAPGLRVQLPDNSERCHAVELVMRCARDAQQARIPIVWISRRRVDSGPAVEVVPTSPYEAMLEAEAYLQKVFPGTTLPRGWDDGCGGGARMRFMEVFYHVRCILIILFGAYDSADAMFGAMLIRVGTLNQEAAQRGIYTAPEMSLIQALFYEAPSNQQRAAAPTAAEGYARPVFSAVSLVGAMYSSTSGPGVVDMRSRNALLAFTTVVRVDADAILQNPSLPLTGFGIGSYGDLTPGQIARHAPIGTDVFIQSGNLEQTVFADFRVDDPVLSKDVYRSFINNVYPPPDGGAWTTEARESAIRAHYDRIALFIKSERLSQFPYVISSVLIPCLSDQQYTKKSTPINAPSFNREHAARMVHDYTLLGTSLPKILDVAKLRAAEEHLVHPAPAAAPVVPVAPAAPVAPADTTPADALRRRVRGKRNPIPDTLVNEGPDEEGADGEVAAEEDATGPPAATATAKGAKGASIELRLMERIYTYSNKARRDVEPFWFDVVLASWANAARTWTRGAAGSIPDPHVAPIYVEYAHGHNILDASPIGSRLRPLCPANFSILMPVPDDYGALSTIVHENRMVIGRYVHDIVYPKRIGDETDDAYKLRVHVLSDWVTRKFNPWASNGQNPEFDKYRAKNVFHEFADLRVAFMTPVEPNLATRAVNEVALNAMYNITKEHRNFPILICAGRTHTPLPAWNSANRARAANANAPLPRPTGGMIIPSPPLLEAMLGTPGGRM